MAKRKSGGRRKRRRWGLSLASLHAALRERVAIAAARRHWHVLAAEHKDRIPARPTHHHETPGPYHARHQHAVRRAALRRAPSIVAALTLAMFGLSLAVTFPVGPRFVRPAEPTPVNWAPPLRGDTLARGTALSHALASRGFDGPEIQEITRLLAPYRDPRALRPGTSLGFSFADDGTPERIRFELNPDSMLYFVRTDSSWTTYLEPVPFVMDTVRIAGVVESSLWSARLSGDVDRFGRDDFETLVYDLADVFAWKVDFTRDLRRGDSFRIAVERRVRPDGTVRSRHFLAIELRNGDRVFRAIPQPAPNGRYTYYDEEGRSLRGAFSRYPVPYRITSHFTTRRFHPILKRWRAHEGIDYGAPYGAPVEATAAGVVTRAGFMGAYGRLVELRHPGNIRTRYAHLSSIAPDVRPGAKVEQGQILGRVGASGLATGPHLHYEFLLSGRHVDPLTVHVPNAPSVLASRLPEYYRERDGALALLQGIPVAPEGVTLATRSSEASPRSSR